MSAPPPDVPVTVDELVTRLLERVPEAADVVAEHRDDHGPTVLVHLLLPDLLRLAVQHFHDGRDDVSARLLDVVDEALRDGDDAVVNAVCVSFVEDAGVFPEETPEFLATWPVGLAAQLERDRQRRAGR